MLDEEGMASLQTSAVLLRPLQCENGELTWDVSLDQNPVPKDIYVLGK